MVGGYDFDLLDDVAGKACAVTGATTTYWVGIGDLGKVSPDLLTRQAIAAAALDSIAHVTGADTLLITRVVTEGKGPNKVCATVVGRAVRLTKAAQRQSIVNVPVIQDELEKRP